MMNISAMFAGIGIGSLIGSPMATLHDTSAGSIGVLRNTPEKKSARSSYYQHKTPGPLQPGVLA